MKRSAALRQAIADLWSHDAATRVAACDALMDLQVGEANDVRSAQPALVWAMRDPDPAVRLAAVHVTEVRADSGCDVGLAVPALIELAGDESTPLRRRVWRALRHASERTSFVGRVPELIERGLADPDAEIVAHARAMQERARI